jgi:myosin heavy subunit
MRVPPAYPCAYSWCRRQLAQLLSVIKSTTPHYVRCIKPNARSVPKEFHRTDVVSQLRCGGVLEAVRVARLGYPVRLPHTLFISQYRCIVPGSVFKANAGVPARDMCLAMARSLELAPEIFQVGVCLLFIWKERREWVVVCVVFDLSMGGGSGWSVAHGQGLA